MCGCSTRGAGRAGACPRGVWSMARRRYASITARSILPCAIRLLRRRLLFGKQTAWRRAGPLAGEDAWVGAPAMNAPIKAMAEQMDVQFGARVESIRTEGKAAWLLGEGLQEGPFDAVVVAVPAEQAGPLLYAHAPDFARAATAVESLPNWTVMAAFDEPLSIADVVRETGAIGWAARDSAKPGRAVGERWVVQATPAWSAQHLELERDEVIALLLAEFAEVAGDLPQALTVAAHRWRYASVPKNDLGALWDAQARIGACGDWLIGPRVENAFLSGKALAERIIASA